METQVAITTFDNPYDPFKEFESWFMFDVEKGYNTCSYLAQNENKKDSMSEQEANAEVERAIDEIIKYDFMNMYKKVKKEKDTTPQE